ncbi:hypothetical protein ACEPAF_9576 [Sanghuangporus sanghuang]|nr:Zn 2Cys6 transcription factor [Sanghuangporus sanghuang]
MNEQDRSRSSYSYQGEDRRQHVLPSISSRLHYNTNTIGDAPAARQAPPESPNYQESGAFSHAAYDPVHDAYDLPRVSSAQTGEMQGVYSSEAYHRADREAMHAYGTSRRYESMTLAPIQTHHHGHLLHAPAHGTEPQPFRPPVRSQSPTGSLHSFQVHTQVHAGGSSSSALAHGGTYPARAGEEAVPYASLPPLTTPGQASTSSGDGKGGSKRIVMACHQCRGRKIRCDAARPACSNCVRRREECRYDEKPRRRGPDKVPGSRMRSCKSRKQVSEETHP